MIKEKKLSYEWKIRSGIVVIVEEHCGLGGNIIIRLDNGAIVGLI